MEQAGTDFASQFPASEYSPIIVNKTYVGGQVRQYGKLSFSRIYKAGHLPGIDQPETVLRVFSRLIAKRSIGVRNRTVGHQSCAVGACRQERQEARSKPMCFIRNFNETCNQTMQNLAAIGGGNIRNGVLIDT